MRVVLINPPINPEVIYGKMKEVGNNVIPLGLAYIGAVLEKEGHDVKIIDADILKLSIDEIVKQVIDYHPSVVGLTANTPIIYSAITIANRIKEVCSYDINIFLGGSHVTAIPYDAMSNMCFDYGFYGEAEETIVEVFRRMQSGKNIRTPKIDGVIYRDKKGKIIVTKKRRPIQDLDSLPLPARHLFPPLDKYIPTPASFRNMPVATMITSRGCPYRCIFCDRTTFGRTFRARTPKNVVNEIEILMKQFGVKEIKFWDDSINIDKKRLINICKEIIKRNINISWTCLARINNMNRALLRWMKKAGCWQIAYGIESGNDEILKNAMKDLTTDMVRKVVNMTKKEGILPRGFFIFGLPGDTKETMQQTIDFAKSLPLDQASFYIATIYPGSELYEIALKSGEGRKLSWDKYSCANPTELSYISKGLTQDILLKYQSKAFREFYIRPGYIIQKIKDVKSLEQLISNIKGLKTVLKFKI